MNRNLGIVVASHLNDAMIEMNFNQELATKRLKFVKALTFFNENLERDVTEKYLNWLWKEIEMGSWGTSFEKYKANVTKKIVNLNK